MRLSEFARNSSGEAPAQVRQFASNFIAVQQSMRQRDTHRHRAVQTMYRELEGHPLSRFADAVGVRADSPFRFMASELLKTRGTLLRVRRSTRPQALPPVADASWIGALPADMQRRVLEETAVETLAAGQYMVREGDLPTCWYGVLQGFVWHLGEGEGATSGLPRRAWYGESFLLEREPCATTLVAAVPSRIARVPLGLFEELICEPDFCRFLMRVQAQRLAAIQRRFSLPRRLTTNARVGLRLAELFSPASLFDGEYHVELSQSCLSTFLGLSRQRTNAALKRLERLGEVDVEYGSLWVRDPGRLMSRVMVGDIS